MGYDGYRPRTQQVPLGWKLFPQIPKDCGCQIVLVLCMECPITVRCERGSLQAVTGCGVRENVEGLACEFELLKKQVSGVENGLLSSSVEQCACPHGSACGHKFRLSGLPLFRWGEKGVDVRAPPAELVDDTAVVLLGLIDDASESSGLLSGWIRKPNFLVRLLVEPGGALLRTELKKLLTGQRLCVRRGVLDSDEAGLFRPHSMPCVRSGENHQVATILFAVTTVIDKSLTEPGARFQLHVREVEEISVAGCSRQYLGVGLRPLRLQVHDGQRQRW